MTRPLLAATADSDVARSRMSCRARYETPASRMPRRSEISLRTTSRSGCREWQRLNQHAVDDAEQRRIDADAKRQAEDDDGGDGPIVDKAADRKANVVECHWALRSYAAGAMSFGCNVLPLHTSDE